MMRIHTDPKRTGSSAEADEARVDVCASYRLGRTGQAPITPAREADT